MDSDAAAGGLPDNDNLEPLFEAIISTIPAPEYEEGVDFFPDDFLLVIDESHVTVPSMPM